MFTPISLINARIFFEVLVQHPIDPFYLAINLWVEYHIKRQFCSHLLEQMLPEACCKLDIFIIYNELKHPMVPNPHLK
jgi:hypothetical protein